MNRKERRAAKIRARKQRKAVSPPVSSVVAAHEAGHAVARYLTAAEMGYTAEEAIFQIEISAPGAELNLGDSFDGTAVLSSQAVTLGPMLSKEMNEIAQERMAPLAGTTISGEARDDFRVQTVSEARASGADIEAWLCARALIAVMGPAVEAMATQKNFYDVWNSYECEADMEGFITDCKSAQVADLEIETRIDVAAQRAGAYLGRQDVCDAVNALAAHLVENGSTDGTTAARIIGAALKSE